MATKNKMLQAAAGNAAGGGSLDIADAFSTDPYIGNGGLQTIASGIDLSGEGGLVWTKIRTQSDEHYLFDTERGADWTLSSNSTGAEQNNAGANFAFSSTGHSINNNWGSMNLSGRNYVHWTFRKAPKFFDVVTYTGNGVSGRAIPHSLGVVPGMVIVKRTDGGAEGWTVDHRSLVQGSPMFLNTIVASASTGGTEFPTEPTDENFYVGTNNTQNGNTFEYVAYIFAHDTADDGVIQCGSYTGNGSTTGPVITLGWEPQWLLVRKSNSTGNWSIFDSKRGLVTGGDEPWLRANLSDAELLGNDFFDATSTGFQFVSGNGAVNTSGDTYIYMAIRGPMMKAPESAAEVFSMDTRGSTGDAKEPAYRSPFAVDAFFSGNTTNGNFSLVPRLTSAPLVTSTTAAETTGNSNHYMDYSNGVTGNTGTNTSQIAFMFKRAKGFFDVVIDGLGSPKAHNLGVPPELIISKGRESISPWYTWLPNTPTNSLGYLNTDAAFTDIDWVADSTTFRPYAHGSGYSYYLFASLAGISKVGSYTGNGSNQTINCGFTSGARFILIKRTDATGDWYFWDTVRGIVAGNDSHLSFNAASAEVTTDDSVDPDSSGFIVNQVAATNINVSAATYIFYAIA
jgi:hypothetical protein